VKHFTSPCEQPTVHGSKAHGDPTPARPLPAASLRSCDPDTASSGCDPDNRFATPHEDTALNKAKDSQYERPLPMRSAPLQATFGDPPPSAARKGREPLDAAGKALLEQLSGKLCLRMTARDFPHVVNKLAPFGYQPARMVETVDKLLIDDRPDREGFPFAVVAELSDLRAFYARLPRY
jgi:hypothetical protein